MSLLYEKLGSIENHSISEILMKYLEDRVPSRSQSLNINTARYVRREKSSLHCVGFSEAAY